MSGARVRAGGTSDSGQTYIYALGMYIWSGRPAANLSLARLPRSEAIKDRTVSSKRRGASGHEDCDVSDCETMP